MNTREDERRLLDLLKLIPWEGEEKRAPAALRIALDFERMNLLDNGTRDYRDVIAEHDRVSVLCMYLLDVFEGAPHEVVTVVGNFVADALGLETESPGLSEAIGRRWIDEVCSLAWRIRTEDMAIEH